MLSRSIAVTALVAALMCGCATVTLPAEPVEAPASRVQQQQAQKAAEVVTAKLFKRKVAIGRFTNETRYGRTFQTDSALDPLGKQASDMLATKLVASNKFLVFERQDLNKLLAEQKFLGQANLVGVDALILGSVTEFGRSISGKSGFLSSTKVQTARAKVEIRLADARTGQIFFTASGVGEATTESGEIAGYGSKAGYDSTLNDRAISAAISDVQNALISKLDERPWRTDILKSSGNTVYISGGSKQGIRVGDSFAIFAQGEKLKSAQSGFEITLPGARVGTIQVTSVFGDAENNEGSVAEVTGGSAPGPISSAYYVSEIKPN